MSAEEHERLVVAGQIREREKSHIRNQHLLIQVFVINYDILDDTLPANVPAKLSVVADEIHACKNYKASRTKRVEVLSKAAFRIWGLTGTPITNAPLELWSVLSVLNLHFVAFGSFSNFIRLFNGYKGPYGYVFSGTPSAQVETCLRKVSLGRLRKDATPQLPGKTYQTIEVEVNAATLKLCDQFVKLLAEKGIYIAEAMCFVEEQEEAHIEAMADADYERRAFGEYR